MYVEPILVGSTWAINKFMLDIKFALFNMSQYFWCCWMFWCNFHVHSLKFFRLVCVIRGLCDLCEKIFTGLILRNLSLPLFLLDRSFSTLHIPYYSIVVWRKLIHYTWVHKLLWLIHLIFLIYFRLLKRWHFLLNRVIFLQLILCMMELVVESNHKGLLLYLWMHTLFWLHRWFPDFLWIWNIFIIFVEFLFCPESSFNLMAIGEYLSIMCFGVGSLIAVVQRLLKKFFWYHFLLIFGLT